MNWAFIAWYLVGLISACPIYYLNWKSGNDTTFIEVLGGLLISCFGPILTFFSICDYVEKSGIANKVLIKGYKN